MQGEGPAFVRVLYNFDYTTKDGRLVSIRQAEKLQLLKRTNADWWQVRREVESKPFYVPAVYVRDVPPAFIPQPPSGDTSPTSSKHEYSNMPACCHQERRQLNSVLRNELITGNYNLLQHAMINGSSSSDKPNQNKRADNEMTPSVRRHYSVVAPAAPKKPVPCPRSLSKSLETLAEEIQFQPVTTTTVAPLWRVEQTSDYNTPSPDYLDSAEDMFWKKGGHVQRSSSFKFSHFRRKPQQPSSHQAAEDSSDSVASRSLESLVDSGAEACSSSSYEWDRTPEDTAAEQQLPPRVTIPKAALAFKNQVYQSTDDEDTDEEDDEDDDDSQVQVRVRPRSSSDTGLSVQVDVRREHHLSRSESHKVYTHRISKEQQPKPLVALKRNQKVVGCRRRPAILCLPSKNSPACDPRGNGGEEEEEGRRRRPPKCPPSPAPHEKPLRVLNGGWAEFYCSDAGGVGRIYYFHAITGLKSWKPPRTKRTGGHDSDRSDSELRSGREQGSRSSRSPSPPSRLVLPPGWTEHYDHEEQQNFYVHQPTGAKAQEKRAGGGAGGEVAGNVADWLHNLRRNTDSSEAEDELRHKVESAAAASGITGVGVAAAASKRTTVHRIKPEIRSKPTMDCSGEDDSTAPQKEPATSSAAWKANPVFKGIELRHDSVDPGADRGGDPRRASFQSLCNEARRASKELIDALSFRDAAPPPADESVRVVVNNPIVKDDDLEAMTNSAISLANEAITACIVDKRLKAARMRTNSGGSDLSDEVFLSCNSEINCIFDHEGASTSPVAPPRRKKRPPESSPEKLKEIRKQIEDLTDKVVKGEDQDKGVQSKSSNTSPEVKVNPEPKKDVSKETAKEVTKETNTCKNVAAHVPEKKEAPKPPKPDTNSSVQRSCSLKLAEPEKKEKSAPVHKSNSLRNESSKVQKEPPSEVPAAASSSRTNSLKRAKEYEEKIQKNYATLSSSKLHRSESAKKIAPPEPKGPPPDSKEPPPEPRAPPPYSKASPPDTKLPPPYPKSSTPDLKSSPPDTRAPLSYCKLSPIEPKASPQEPKASPPDTKAPALYSKSSPPDQKSSPPDVKKPPPYSKASPPDQKAPPPEPKVPPPEPKEPPQEPKTTPPPSKYALPPTKDTEPSFSVQLVERKTFYPEISKDNKVILPVVSQNMKDLLVDSVLEDEASDLDNSMLSMVSEDQVSAEESFRSRKGSNGSDIVAWKKELMNLFGTNDEEDEVYHTPRTEWFSSSDADGHLYFFAENSTESSWGLPKTPAVSKAPAPPPPNKAPPPRTTTPGWGSSAAASVALQGVVPVLRRFELEAGAAAAGEDDSSTTYKPRKTMGPCVLPPLPNSRATKSQSMIVPDIKTPVGDSHEDVLDQPKPPWAIIIESGQNVIKEGPLQRAKIMDCGKKVKKNWNLGYVLLTNMRMLFFKDIKNYNAMRENQTNAAPEMSLELQLNGRIQKAEKDSSSRKNAFLVTNDRLQVLCQEENIEAAESWFYNISLTINNLSNNHLNTLQRYPLAHSRDPSPNRGSVSPEANRSASVNRSKSVKSKKDSESTEDLTAENHTKIKAGLKKFFKRRPTMDSLVKKGIYKDEPAFGSSLAKLCADCSPGPNPQIPRFVKACIEAIERKPENLRTDGIYRASGNLSQVQRIRLHVDQNKLEVLDQEEEVHVLTGALKLFFRELKEPLIPFDAFQRALDANNHKDKREKLRLFKELMQCLPRPNYDTLKYLLEHLLRVTENQSFNRMHIPNLAIVFGPTLMWPEQESLEMALTLMQQNVVVECLLQEFDSIFN